MAVSEPRSGRTCLPPSAETRYHTTDETLSARRRQVKKRSTRRRAGCHALVISFLPRSLLLPLCHWIHSLSPDFPFL